MVLFGNRKVSISTVLLGLLLLPSAGSPQGLGALVGNTTSSAAPVALPADPLKRTSPRSAIYAFLQVCHQTNYELAAQYLDLRRIRSDQRPVQGPELAKQLGLVLDRDTEFEVSRLSADPAGSVRDGLSPNLDELHQFDVNQEHITLHMQRQLVNDQQLWLVASESVAKIPQLAAAMVESPIEKRLPAALVTTHLLGAPIWIWLALLLAALLVAAFSRLLAKAVLAILMPVAKRFSNRLHPQRLTAFIGPLRLIVAAVLFRTCMELIGPSALLRDVLMKMIAFLVIWGIASIFMVIADVVSDTITSRLNVKERAVSYSVVALLVRSVKILVAFLAILIILGNWGYNVNALLAGLGVGGIAVALAAQKTIENLFGGIAVISDKPVLVGDFCNYGGQVGTVEDIGLRSTRIRTLDRTVVTIPNASFSTLMLENYSKRDRMWFHPTLNLSRETPSDKIRAMMDAVVAILHHHPNVDPTDVPLRFTKIATESFDLEVFAYVLTDDFNEYLKTQSDLLLSIVKAASELSVEFALPVQKMVLPSTPASRNASSTAPVAGS